MIQVGPRGGEDASGGRGGGRGGEFVQEAGELEGGVWVGGEGGEVGGPGGEGGLGGGEVGFEEVVWWVLVWWAGWEGTEGRGLV